MSDAAGPIPAAYRDRVRVRVSALLVDRDEAGVPRAVLLAEHAGLWDEQPFWAPPGGGVEPGEPLAGALRREVQEETGLDVTVGALRYVLDFVRAPLHAVSFYFECACPDLHAASLGSDPELGDAQLLRSLCLVPMEELGARRIYPEPFEARLAADVRAGFPEGTVYLGTFR